MSWLDRMRKIDKARKAAEMTHAGRYDNDAIRKERWTQVKNAPGQYAQGMFTDFVGAPVDIANIALTPFGLGREKPILGSRHLADLIGADESAVPYQIAQYMPLDAGDVAMSAKLWGPALAAALGGTAIAAKASQGAKLSDLAQVMPKQRGIFAGVGAKTADKKALAQAEQLHANYPVSQFDVPVSDQIVRYGDDVAMSASNNPDFSGLMTDAEKAAREYEALRAMQKSAEPKHYLRDIAVGAGALGGGYLGGQYIVGGGK